MTIGTPVTGSRDIATPIRGPERLASGWPVLLVLALATILRLYHLGAENYWIDEIFSLGQAGSPIAQIVSYWDPEFHTSPRPLGLVLLYAVLHLGESEWLTRLPYAILSILDVGVIMLLSREVVARRVWLRAGLFLALLPIHVWYAQEVRWYSQWALLTTLSYLALLKAWRTERLRWWIGFMIAAALNVYTFVVTLPVLTMQAVTAWFLPDRGSRRAFRLKAFAAMAGVGLLALPALSSALGLLGLSSEFPALGIGGPGSGVVSIGTPRSTSLAAVPYTFFAYLAGFSIGPTVAELHALPAPLRVLREYPEVLACLVAVPLLAGSGLWALRKRPAAAALLLPWAVGVPLLVIAMSMLGGPTYNVRYTFAAVPGFALLMAVGVEAFGRWRWLGTFGVVALAGLSLANYYWAARYDKEDVRAAVAEIRSQAGPEVPVAVIGQGLAAVQYYGAGLEVGRLRGCPSERAAPDDAGGLRFDELRAEPELWIVVSRDWGNTARGCLRGFELTHDVVARDEYTGVEIFRLEHR